jgi:hypothetical protein
MIWCFCVARLWQFSCTKSAAVLDVASFGLAGVTRRRRLRGKVHAVACWVRLRFLHIAL